MNPSTYRSVRPSARRAVGRLLVQAGILLATFGTTVTASAEEVLRLSMLPRHSAESISSGITPLAQHLSKALGIKVEPVVMSDFAKYEQGIANGNIDIGYENPLIYANQSGVHEAVAMAAKGTDGVRFRGIIITRSDSAIVEMRDLVGKTVSIVGRTSAGGFLSQKLSLMEAGIDVDKDLTISEALENKQENVIFAVYQGDVDAGFIRESELSGVEKYVPMSKIRVIKRTAWLPNWALSVKRALPDNVKAQIRTAVTSLQNGDPVLAAMKIEGFRAADDTDFDPIRKAMGTTPAP